jgi:hypothetical protein
VRPELLVGSSASEGRPVGVELVFDVGDGTKGEGGVRAVLRVSGVVVGRPNSVDGETVHP